MHGAVVRTGWQTFPSSQRFKRVWCFMCKLMHVCDGLQLAGVAATLRVTPALVMTSYGNSVTTASHLYPSARRHQLAAAAAVQVQALQQQVPLHPRSQHEQRGQSPRRAAAACRSAAWAPPPQLLQLP